MWYIVHNIFTISWGDGCLVAACYGVATWFLSEAEQNGSGAVRWRIYFIAIRVPKAIAGDDSQLKPIIEQTPTSRLLLLIEVVEGVEVAEGGPRADEVYLGGNTTNKQHEYQNTQYKIV